MPEGQAQDFASIKSKLDSIVESVSDENLSLDAALDLYEEAVSLGLQASNLLEEEVLNSADSDSNPSDTDASEQN